MSNISKSVYPILKDSSNKMLQGGEFPEVNYRRDGFFERYNGMEHAVFWSKFCFVVSQKLEDAGIEGGVFTKKRSAAVLKKISDVVAAVTAEEVKKTPFRFRSWMD